MGASDLQFEGLLASIDEYRKKYYQNQLFKGSLIAIALLLSLFLFVSTVEYFGRFSSFVRGFLFFGYVGVFIYVLYRLILTPLFYISGIAKPLSDEEAARQIGKQFPSISDKLLNTLQLGNQQQSDLIQASIRQKSGQLMMVRFSEAVNFNENKRYFKYAAYPIAAVAFILLFKPSFLTSGSERIIRFNTNFNYAPFTFLVENNSLKTFRNEDFTVKVKLTGNTLPDHVYLISNKTRFRLNQDGEGRYSYLFKSVQKEVSFHLEAAGFNSDTYKIEINERPALLSFDVRLDYPAYLGKPSELLKNAGNLNVPEGTNVRWRFRTAAAKSLSVRFDQDSSGTDASGKSPNQFDLNRTLRRSSGYHVTMVNDDMPEGQQVSYFANVIADKYPELAMENFQDTTFYNYLVVGGGISDDYGFTQLRLFYNIVRKGDQKNRQDSGESKSLAIPFNKQANNQSYYFQWYVDSLQLQPGDRLEYYAQVWDNDGVNGPKSSRSKSLVFSIPDKALLREEISRSSVETQNQIEQAINKAKSLDKDLKELENKLKANNVLDFQERKMAEEILKKREELISQIQSLQEKNRISNEKSRQFDQPSESFQKKMDELQNLMNELLQDESKKLYQDLEKLLEQNQSERMSKLLERLQNKEKNTEKELERTLNLFKKLQLEQKMESVIDELETLADEQEKLAEKSEKAKDPDEERTGKNETNRKTNSDDLKDSSDPTKNLLEEQEKISQEFKQLQERLGEIEKLGEEINQKPDTQKEAQKSAQEAQKESKQQLSKQQNSKASESQKKASKSMRKIGESLQEQMMSGQTMQMQEDMDSLRDILENLHTLSFDQEALMKDFKGVNLSDPRFVPLGQRQLKLQDDAKIVEDSLYALANRVLEIQSFVTRELTNMKFHMGESVKNIKDRKLGPLASQQQFSMTSINNLALMLSDVFARMQEALAMAMMMPGSGDQKSKGNSPGEMQQQLNEKMKEMGEGSSNNPGMSERLARMAAEQAAIREMVQKLLDSQKGNEFSEEYGQQLQEIMDQMEKSETSIVNKKIDQKLIERNEEMLTRLLESEKALREQDEDEQRKGETARQYLRQPPPAFEEYIRTKSRQTELLRTVPPNFTPFYKREADSYFQRSGVER